MKWREITDRQPALAAIAEFEQLGRTEFLSKYGFGPSTRWFVRHEGKKYDMKALAGAMHGFADPVVGPKKSEEFSSGKSLVELFRRLGFEVVESYDAEAIRHATALSAALDGLLAGYVEAKSTKISKASPMWEAIKKAQSALKGLTAEYPHIDVKSSVGKGNWAEVPWIALLDDRITDTTKHGVDAVYLFRADMTGVYVSLNQGVTTLKSELGWPAARKQLAETASTLRERYAGRLPRTFTSGDGIDLRSKRGGLGAGYEASTIAWRLYQTGAIPAPDELLADLYRLLDVYDDYASAPQVSKMPTPLSGKQIVRHVRQCLAAEGLHFSEEQVADFYLAVRTKPFVLLAGISGTGKSILARRFAAACGFPAPLIAVRPDWSEPSELLGYRDLEGVFVPGRLIPHLVAAAERPDRPYFVILDEMNLARVEHYFADLLSVMETRRTVGDRVVTDTLDLGIGPDTDFRCDDVLAARLKSLLSGRGLVVPSNLCVIGTVNMDESTHPFSKKVLDRAMTLEFVTVDLRAVPVREVPPAPISVGSGDLDAPHLSLSQVYAGREAFFQPAIDLLVELNAVLTQASMQVGYRTRDEVCLYLFHNAEQALLDTQVALDLAVYHKVLPRLQGGEEIRELLAAVHQLLSGRGLSRCVGKIDEMQQRLERAGFTAFWA